MTYRIFAPQKFGANRETGQDAFTVAAGWLDQLESEGWEPASEIIVSGTTGFLTLLGQQRTNLLFRRMTPMDSRESMTEPTTAPPAKKRGSK